MLMSEIPLYGPTLSLRGPRRVSSQICVRLGAISELLPLFRESNIWVCTGIMQDGLLQRKTNLGWD